MAEGGAIPAAIDDVVFLGRAVERLSVLIAEQSETIFEDFGVVIPVRSCSLMTVLASLNAASASDLAKELGQSHQLVLQKLPKLLRLGLITFEQDKNDARRKIFSLTPAGRGQLEIFEKCRLLIRAAYIGLFAEIGDVYQIVARTTDALNGRTLHERIKPFI